MFSRFRFLEVKLRKLKERNETRDTKNRNVTLSYVKNSNHTFKRYVSTNSSLKELHTLAHTRTQLFMSVTTPKQTVIFLGVSSFFVVFIFDAEEFYDCMRVVIVGVFWG